MAEDKKISGPFSRRLWLLAGALLLAAACSKPPVSGLKPPTNADVIETAPVSLRVETLNFKWAYADSGETLSVAGRVKNNTGRVQRPVFLYAMLFDETGLAVGMGEAKVSPEALVPGAEGEFRLKVKTSRPRQGRSGPIRHLRLLTNARNE